MDNTEPVFSWQMKTTGENHNIFQKSYQLTVTSEKGNEVWNTGKVISNRSIQIKYSGRTLKPTRKYFWTLKVWDSFDRIHTSQSWFETGFMDDTMVKNKLTDKETTAWSGAKWIGGSDDDLVLYSTYLPVFTINFNINLDSDSNSKKAALIFGANDPRLMDKYKNLYNIENKKDSSYIKIELDNSPLKLNQNAQLNIYRVGYHPKDNVDLPFDSFKIPRHIINSNNQYQTHSILIKTVLGKTEIYIDGKNEDNLIGSLNLNPLGEGGDFIAFPVLGDIGFSVPAMQKAYFSNLEVRNFRSPSNIIFTEKLHKNSNKSIFKSSPNIRIQDSVYYINGGKSGNFTVANPSRNSMPIMRTSFNSDSLKIMKARLYITARGIYKAYLNGREIGNHYFNPGFTQYNKTHFYQTYDVTDIVQQGENAFGVILGEGWWSGNITFLGEKWNFFGDRQSVLAKLVITYADQSQKIVTTDSHNWKYTNSGPVIYGSLLQGEVYDARKQGLINGWSTPSFNDDGWHQVSEISTEGFVSKEGTSDLPDFNDYTDGKLIGQIGKNVKAIKELKAQCVKEVRPGVYIYDMGQNMVGVPNIKFENLGSGKKITFRFAEVLYPELSEYNGNEEMLMLENIRAAMAQDIYITKGGRESFNPQFTFHGYRYIEISGIEKPLPLSSVKGTVLSSIDTLSSRYETSNPIVNKLWENITWSFYGNFLSIPTDCPQRNERLGWSGDISVFSRTATYLSDIQNFLKRHMIAMRDIQSPEGRFPDVAPLNVGFGETLWGSAGITVAWESYIQYGDLNLLEHHYGAMKSYIDYLIRDIDPDTGILKENERDVWSSLGDWLSLESSKNEKTLFWEAYFIYDLDIMKKVATILNKREDKERFSKYLKDRKAFFNNTYIDKATGKTAFREKLIDTQTSYALPIVFDILNKENLKRAIKHFSVSINRENTTDNGLVCPPYSLMTGFIGTAWVNKALSDSGYNNIAYHMLQQTSYPSWLYPVTQGATTIWERLNSYTDQDGFGGNNRMNSFNHYAFGAIGAWMYNYSLGIRRDENSPGFKHFVLQPEPDPTGQMTYAKGHYDSMYGTIESGWFINEKSIDYHFKIPPNTTATLKINGDDPSLFLYNGVPLTASPNANYKGKEFNKHIFELNSGVYKIHYNKKN